MHNEYPGMDAYLARFIEWSKIRGYTDRTCDTRQRAIQAFIDWCTQRSLDQPQEITPPILERYRQYLYYYRKANGKPLTLGTQRARLVPVRAFFTWLAKERYILYNPASELELPRQPQRLPQHILTIDEIETILNQTHYHGDIGIRDRAIIETLYSTGIRKMEIIALKLYDLDLANGTLMVREGKGKKDRVVPIGERACRWLEKYIEEIRPALVAGKDDGTVFLTDKGEAMINHRLSEMVRKYIDLAGIEKPGACHLFRHSMATHMLENGADIRYIQAILGHANLTTTEIYTQVSIRQLKEIHRATHPARMTRQGQNQ